MLRHGVHGRERNTEMTRHAAEQDDRLWTRVWLLTEVVVRELCRVHCAEEVDVEGHHVGFLYVCAHAQSERARLARREDRAHGRLSSSLDLVVFEPAERLRDARVGHDDINLTKRLDAEFLSTNKAGSGPAKKRTAGAALTNIAT